MAGPPTARVPVVIDTSRLTPQVVALREFGLAIAAACDRYLEVFVDAPGVPDAAVLSVVPDVAPTSSGMTDNKTCACGHQVHYHDHWVARVDDLGRRAYFAGRCDVVSCPCGEFCVPDGQR